MSSLTWYWSIDPIQRAAVAQAVAENLRRDAGQRERVVDLERRFVLAQPHLLDAVRERHVGRFDPLQRPRLQLFIVQVQLGQLLAGRGEGPEVGGQRDPRQFAFQVLGEPLAVARMVQDAVDVIEDVPLGDFLVAVVLAEVLQGPIGDVLAAVAAVFVVDVEGETLTGRRPPTGSDLAIRLPTRRPRTRDLRAVGAADHGSSRSLPSRVGKTSEQTGTVIDEQVDRSTDVAW